MNDKLSEVRALAARLVHSGDNMAMREVQELPLATQQTRRYQIPLVCPRTDITVGALTTINVAGHMPLLGDWRETQVLHPIFSLQPVALLQFARNTWLRFCALTTEESIDPAVSAAQEKMLCIATLAMLHHLTDVRQDIPWIPAWKDVSDNWTSLMAISYWKAYLDSERFKFPQLRISKLEKDVDLKHFLQICWQRKKEYENKINTLTIEQAERDKLALAESSMVKQRDAVAGKRPLSIKLLWRWFEQNMPKRYAKDMDVPTGWMWEIFTADSKSILEYTVRDVEMFEEIVVSECPTGSTISHAFLEIIRSKHELLTAHFNTYEIIIPDSIAAAVAGGEIEPNKPAPVITDYPTRMAWFKAKCQWDLAQVGANKHQKAEAARQETVTVNPSFTPTNSYLQSVIDAAASDEGETNEADSQY